MNSRKISIRVPDLLWNWLTAQVGGQPISALIIDYLSRFKSGRVITAITSKEWVKQFLAYAERHGLSKGTVPEVLDRVLSDAVAHEACQTPHREENSQ